MPDFALPRRTVLKAGVGGAALAAIGGTAACSNSGSSSGGTVQDAGVKLPTYVRFTGVTPDLPGTDDGIPDTFFAYPKNPVRATQKAPGDGSVIRGSVPINSPVPPSMDRNSYWKKLNQRLGSKLPLTITPYADFSQRFATAVAGDDLGDVFTIDLGFAQLPQFLEAKCQDLTPFLGGDAIKEYPFLANLPTDSWRGTVYNGGIYSLPISRGVQTSTVLYTRSDLFAERGVDPNPTTIDEFVQTCEKMTDERSNTWALTGVPMAVLQQMYGLPNNWSVDNKGKFTNALELDGYKEALNLGRQLLSKGVVHPDSIDAATSDQKTWFGAGASAIHQDTYSAMGAMYKANSAGLKNFRVGLMLNPSESGKPAALWLGNPNNTISALKKADEGRIRLILGVLNYLATPIGTEEHLFRAYGTEGVDYTLKGSDPILTSTGTSETSGGSFPVEYLIAPPRPAYYPGNPQAARDIYAHMKKVVPTGVKDPTIGLYSTTQGTKGGQLNTTITDAVNAILQGRKPVSSWDKVVATWRQSGGDTIRNEYQQAYAKLNGR